MDPIAHTLVGAALAGTRLGRTTARAAPALILGANAPDLDAAALFISRDLALGVRRGWTHGVLALVVLPLALTALLLLIDRLAARRRGDDAGLLPAGAPSRDPGRAASGAASPPARPWVLLALSALAVASHPVLDWLNTYGVRFLMPFDGRWFYGDALFVVDPWVWLLAGTPVVLAHSASRAGAAAWTALGVATTALVTGVGGVPPATRLLWCAGVAALVGLRWTGRWRTRLPQVAAICLAAAACYIAAMVGASRAAERQVTAWLADRAAAAPASATASATASASAPPRAAPEEVLAIPAPGNPLRRDIVVADADHYHFLELDWLASPSIRIAAPSIPRGGDTAVTRAALTAPHVRGIAVWLRFPAFRVEETADGYRVSITDVRYTRRVSGLGAAVVELDRNLRVRAP